MLVKLKSYKIYTYFVSCLDDQHQFCLQSLQIYSAEAGWRMWSQNISDLCGDWSFFFRIWTVNLKSGNLNTFKSVSNCNTNSVTIWTLSVKYDHQSREQQHCSSAGCSFVANTGRVNILHCSGVDLTL